MRQAHAGLTDEGFATRVATAQETETPLTRKSLTTPHVSKNSGENECDTNLQPFAVAVTSPYTSTQQEVGGIEPSASSN